MTIPQLPSASSAIRPARPLAAAPAAAGRARAQGGDPLPSFKTSQDYKNYVINLVGQSQGVQRELEAARKSLNGPGGEGAKLVVATLQERLDALKLQLKILRDDYPIPSEWTRSKLLLGEGFDKDAFWKSQVEAIPGKEVVVAMAPPPPPKPAAPAPEPPKPAAAPAAPTPAAVGTSGDLPAPIASLLVKYADEGAQAYNNSGGNAFARGKLQAMVPLLTGKADPAARQALEFVKATLAGYDGNYTETHYGYQAAFKAVKTLIAGSGSLQQRHDAAIGFHAAEGAPAYNNSGGNLFARQKLIAIIRHAEMGTDERSQAIAALAKQVRGTYDGNYTETHYGYMTTFASVTALLSNAGTIDSRKKGVIGRFAAEGLQAYNNSGGNLFARERLKAIVRLTSTSSDPAMQAVDQLVKDCLRAHDGNYTQTHTAYMSTFQAVQALLA